MTSAGDVTFLAGRTGEAGSEDGTRIEARFRYPQGLAVDTAGNVYVADSGNNTIRRVTPNGVVTTLAGFPRRTGSADGIGSAAEFNYPNSVAVDSAGNVYVADLYNNTIRKVTPGGEVTTLAGRAGDAGSADGTGAAARFNFPQGVAVDRHGNVFVADTFNNAIRKITPAGVVTTLAGRLTYDFGSEDGTGGAARFHYPCSLGVDTADNIYVSDTGNNTIRRLTPAGMVTTLGGFAGQAGSADGTGRVARFWHPGNIAINCAGEIYLSDPGNSAIRKGMAANGTAAAIPQNPGASLSSTAR